MQAPKGGPRRRRPALPRARCLRPGAAPWGQFSVPGQRGLQAQGRAWSPERHGGLPDTPEAASFPAVPAPRVPGLGLSYNEICSKPPDRGARTGRASLGLGMGSTSQKASQGGSAGPRRSPRRPGWAGTPGLGLPMLASAAQRAPHAAARLRPLSRFGRRFLQRPQNVQVRLSPDQEAQEAAAQVRPGGSPRHLACSPALRPRCGSGLSDSVVAALRSEVQGCARVGGSGRCLGTPGPWRRLHPVRTERGRRGGGPCQAFSSSFGRKERPRLET